jgi:hypothetical protein
LVRMNKEKKIIIIVEDELRGSVRRLKTKE